MKKEEKEIKNKKDFKLDKKTINIVIACTAIVIAILLITADSLLGSAFNQSYAYTNNIETDRSTNDSQTTTNDNQNTDDDTSSDTETPIDTAIASFTKIEFTEFMANINTPGVKFLYIGRTTCGACLSFMPTLKQVIDDYGTEILYVDADTLNFSSAEVNTFKAMDARIPEVFRYVPMHFIIKDGVIVHAAKGVLTYEELVTLFKTHGLIPE